MNLADKITPGANAQSASTKIFYYINDDSGIIRNLVCKNSNFKRFSHNSIALAQEPLNQYQPCLYKFDNENLIFLIFEEKNSSDL